MSDDTITITITMILDTYIIPFLSGNFPYATEFKLFFQGYAGFMGLRRVQQQQQQEDEQQKHWFHTFCIGLMTAFGGGVLTPIWLGRPSFLIANDLIFGIAVLAYTAVYVLPFGFTVGKMLPMKVVTSIGSTMFKSTGIATFVSTASGLIQPSAYYPSVAVFGPILWAVLLANMGAFFLKGFHAHLQNGIPYPAQNAFILASFYHFYVNDRTGIIGTTLRTIIQDYLMTMLPLPISKLDDRTFATVVISLFMQIVALLQMILGPSFNPYSFPSSLLFSITTTKTKSTSTSSKSDDLVDISTLKKKKKKKKNQ